MLAGIDVGSTGLKVSLFSETGERLQYAYREYMLNYHGSRVELDPEVWWRSLCSCVEEIAGKCSLSGLRGLAISHANALILADAELRPLFPAIMQLDKRGEEMLPLLDEELGGGHIFEITGNRIAAGYVWGPTLKWLSVHEPEAYRRVRYLFNPASYLVMRLTGAYCMDCTRAATTMLCDIRKGVWSSELCTYFQLPPEVLPKLCHGDEIVGATTGSGNLPSGIPVAAGVMDTVSAMVGLSSGQAEDALILGSVGRFGLKVRQLDRRFLNTVTPDRSACVAMTPVNNAGLAIRWARDLLLGSTGQRSYGQLNQLAAQAPPGADGLLFLPYLNGASCPNWDSGVRGCFLNIGAQHTRAHFARAVFEGVGYALAENLLALRKEGAIRSLDRIFCGGGGANSQLWTQILCDILGCGLIIPENLETETIGCALLAGQAAGALENRASWNRPLRTLQPNEEAHELYQQGLEAFISRYTLLREMQKAPCPSARCEFY